MTFNKTGKQLLELYHAALNAVDPYASVKRYKDRILDSFRSARCTRLICVAFGKAACPMAKAVEDVCGDLVDAKCGHYKIRPLQRILVEKRESL